MTLLLFLLAVAAPLTFAMENSSLNEAQVFEWWDDGIIDGDEAHEILDLLEEGNTQEACILAEVYALESCASEDIAPVKTKKQRKAGRLPRVISLAKEKQQKAKNWRAIFSHRWQLPSL